MSKKSKRTNKKLKESTCCITHALISESIANYGADTFWLASLFDAVTYWSLSPIEILGISTGVSIPALAVGSALALISSLGYAASRQALNVEMHDRNNNDDLDSSTEEDYGTITKDIEAGTLMDEAKKEIGGLSWWQYLKLSGHFTSSAGDVAAMPVVAAALLSHIIPLPKWGNLIVRCGATLWGATAAIASTQSCANAMKSLNKQQG